MRGAAFCRHKLASVTFVPATWINSLLVGPKFRMETAPCPFRLVILLRKVLETTDCNHLALKSNYLV